ncbi:RidA family protein [Rhodococcus rhodochrous]|uniref:RidA family protein n=1 Tax=Rhodococcus rhodochrous TaxID=1829 RepID=UPI001780FCA3|nr:RidA family protein [Rhodococcus rhodochrous]QOH59423.1 RidA family protein [Rhodococcus rhodochrous]
MTEHDRREIRVDNLAEPLSHYTDVVVYNGLAFISGFLGVDRDGSLVDDNDVVAQARQSLQNLAHALDAVDSSFADVLKVTVYLTDVNDLAAINPVRQEFFGDARPASTLVEVAALALPYARVEIEAVAAVRTV